MLRRSLLVAWVAVALAACGSEAAMSDADGGNPECAACIDEALRWELEGGLVPVRSVNEIRACRTYVRTHTMAGSGASASCSNQVPCVGQAITIDDVNAALAHPDVVAAFAAAPVIYGVEARPVDGPLFQITHGDRTIGIGFPCQGESGCIDVPPGVDALRALLTSLESERLAEEDCASTFPSP